MQLSEKQKTFPEFFSAISKCRLNLKPFQKKMFLIAELIPKLRTRKM